MMPRNHVAKAFQDFCRKIKQVELPGRPAQSKMDPLPEQRPDVITIHGASARNSAVLILFSLEQPGSLLFTLRNTSLPNHGGQISFPGGQLKDRETALQAACRETEEEVGIKPCQYEVTGNLSSLYVTPSHFIIHPWLAFCESRPDISIQRSEVSEAFWVKLDDLTNRENIRTMTKTWNHRKLHIPYWDIHSVPLWGATAMITSEVVAIYHRFLNHEPNQKKQE